MNCEKCVNKNTDLCSCCCWEPDYKPRTISYYSPYIPTCPRGYVDCIYDPAYIKFYYSDWYEELYGQLTPEEASNISCKKKSRRRSE